MIRVIKHTERCKATCFTDSDPPPKTKESPSPVSLFFP